MSIPPWLFDLLGDSTDDNDELRALATAWSELLAGPADADASNGKPCFDMGRYRELRAAAHPGDIKVHQQRYAPGWPHRGEAEHADYWPTVVKPPEPDETVYLTPARAAEIVGCHQATLAAARRRGELRSIGMTPTEYKRARERAGWADASGWGARAFYLREDVERLARERGAQ